jgi:hypothetical protein
VATKEPSRRNILRGALGPGDECPQVEELIRAVAEPSQPASTELANHLKSCDYCQTELHLWKTFDAGSGTQTSKDVHRVTAQLHEKMRGVFIRPPSLETPGNWWKQVFSVRWLAPATLAMAGLLLVAGIVVKYRQASPLPAVDGRSPFGQEVFRSPSLTVVGPSGDLQNRPSKIHWESIPGATKYVVRLLEVDHTEIWRAETSEDHVELAQGAQARIVPRKTLFLEITAFDSSGSKVGETGLVRFRLLRDASVR